MTKSRKTGHLLTEKINPRTSHLDQCSTEEILRLILAEDGIIPEAVGKEKRRIAEAVELIVERLGTLRNRVVGPSA